MNRRTLLASTAGLLGLPALKPADSLVAASWGGPDSGFDDKVWLVGAKLWLAHLDGSKIGPFPIDEEWADKVWHTPGSQIYGYEITAYPYRANYPWVRPAEDGAPFTPTEFTPATTEEAMAWFDQLLPEGVV